MWKPCPGFERYEVSDDGQVRSWAQGGSWGTSRRSSPRVLRQCIDSSGYPIVTMPLGDGVFRNKRVARLVLETFVGPSLPLQECCHLNGVRTDSRLANLRWGTRSENHRMKREHGTDHRGERAPAAALTNSQAAEILAKLEHGQSGAALAREYGVSDSTVSRVKLRQAYHEAGALVSALEAAPESARRRGDGE